jgi:ubiquinone biosynthesis monooxygenase Coq7
MTSLIDDFILQFDKGLRAVFGASRAARELPGAELPEGELTADDRRHAAVLMRVNHCGEVCAQALYQGQAAGSSNAALKQELAVAAREEEDHLAWTEARIAELGGRTSFLNPLWYGASFAIGFAAGKAGDKWNLGFLNETERQVEAHLHGHLERLSPLDVRTRAIVEQMKTDEAGHADKAVALGAAELPLPVRQAMRGLAKVMTGTTYWV